ncbi:MAG TPA: BMC domain-containing protein [bacterium]|nr:BMC domain-containing protein [bacterium]HOH06229.1 BMC domain-containing protein [bacterium]HOY43656.1 BMC domain-containing protein [bacterium]HPG81816.1 BMC domain-containing protein [bacterium]HPM59356.1 BMC domain-containing protein [bacterium]
MAAAIGLVELSSIAKGIEVADAMVKRALVEVVVNRTICPGKYMVLVNGDVDDVNASIETGVELGGHQVVDHFVIPNVHRSVFPALSGISHTPELRALGIIESFSVASAIEAADAAVKAAAVDLLEIHIAMAIGGKAYVTLTGDVAAVQSAVDAGAAVVKRRGLLVEKIVIPSPRKEILAQFF